MKDAEELAHLRAWLTELEAVRARRRAAYEAIGVGSLDPAFGRATYRYAVSDLHCAWVEDRINEIERRMKRAA